ncbi:hypothetical protein AB0B13_05190 [Streptomyces sp. NPDC042898]|uniref:hypothetical protein n=1 Tax=Streptomyces sp. NPDC042898 TaxID=3154334 RepID=UPI0033FBB1B8
MRVPTLLELGADQLAVVDLPFHGSHVITGTPGTGKTVMAVYRAWALATAGRDVVLLTRSNLLHQYLAQMAPTLTEAVRVTTYHRWIRKFWDRNFTTGLPVTDENGWSYDWARMQRDCILGAVGSTTHLVIDDGQNLPVAFYRWCRVLGIPVTVCADESRPIGDEQSTVSEICRAIGLPDEPLVLRENHRNSRAITTLASEFRMRAGDETAVPAHIGPTPMVMKVASLEPLLQEILRYFSAHPERSIGIICRSAHVVRDVQSGLTDLGLAKHTQAYVYGDRYRDTVDFSTRPIRIVSTASMKGLEFDSVFVPDLDAYTEDPTGVEARLRFLVLCTRARKDLHFAHRGHQEPAILSGIPETLLTRHAG